MKGKSLLVFVCVLLTVVSGLLIYNKISYESRIEGKMGSVALAYAVQHGYKDHESNIDENNKFNKDLHLEYYKYEENGNKNIIIKEYEGLSDKIYIPSYINNKIVSVISDDFVDSNSSVKEIYLGYNVTSIPDSIVDKYDIYCVKTDYCSELVEKNKAQYTSEFTTRYNESFEYELLADNTLKITNYKGKKSNLIVPTTINGYSVSEVGFDGKFNSIYIPSSVNKITGKIELSDMVPMSTVIVLSVIVFNLLIAIVVILTAVKKNSVIINVLSMLYLLIPIFYSYSTADIYTVNNRINYTYLGLELVTTIVFVIITMIVAGYTRSETVIPKNKKRVVTTTKKEPVLIDAPKKTKTTAKKSTGTKKTTTKKTTTKKK